MKKGLLSDKINPTIDTIRIITDSIHTDDTDKGPVGLKATAYYRSIIRPAGIVDKKVLKT